MTMSPTRIKLLVLLIASSLALTASGCVSVGLNKKFPDIKTYSLDLTAAHLTSFKGTPVSVRIHPFSSNPFFEDRYLAYRSGETTYEQDFYNQLTAAPAKILQDQVAVWLKDSSLVAIVVTPDMASGADCLIDGRLLELSGDYRVESAPKAVLKLQLTVSEMDSGNAEAFFQKVYTAEVPMRHIAPSALTEGWNEGLGQIMTQFEKDLEGLIVSAPAKE